MTPAIPTREELQALRPLFQALHGPGRGSLADRLCAADVEELWRDAHAAAAAAASDGTGREAAAP